MNRVADGAAERAVVLLSGGLDSATVLAGAIDEGLECHALSFRYGQRHDAELDAAVRIARALAATSHRVIAIDLGAIGGSALTDARISVPEAPTEGIPSTYVPARNSVFLALGMGVAEVLDAAYLYIGVNAVDYSGYPDCRPEFIEAFQSLAAVATRRAVEGAPLVLRAPLLHLTKAEIIRRGIVLGVDYSLTVSCYQAGEGGVACGLCDACRLRRAGFEAAGVPDPTRYRG
ncbi:MAG: 7-cyano-7-deazaguanine synthase QueC [Gammaproteobacteria bacterium]